VTSDLIDAEASEVRSQVVLQLQAGRKDSPFHDHEDASYQEGRSCHSCRSYQVDQMETCDLAYPLAVLDGRTLAWAHAVPYCASSDLEVLGRPGNPVEAYHRMHPGDVACVACQVGPAPADSEANSSDVAGEVPVEDLFARTTLNCSMTAVVIRHFPAKRICWVRLKPATVVALVTRRANLVVRVASVLLELVLSEQQEWPLLCEVMISPMAFASDERQAPPPCQLVKLALRSEVGWIGGSIVHAP
jgi:hypothetical protein